MRPLYIDGPAGCRVIFDNPALRIIVPDQADQLFPLQRISRVTCRGSVDWSMPALFACADQGIHLLFLNNDGNIRARWLSWGSEKQSLTQRLIDLLARTDGPELYANWYLSMEKMAARSFARRAGLLTWRECSVAELRQGLKTGLDDEGWRRVQLLESMLYGELLIWLPKYGFEQENEILVSSELDLTADLSRLLLWDCYLVVLNSSQLQAEIPLYDMVAIFQQRSDRCYSLFRSIINKLHLFLLRVN